MLSERNLITLLLTFALVWACMTLYAAALNRFYQPSYSAWKSGATVPEMEDLQAPLRSYGLFDGPLGCVQQMAHRRAVYHLWAAEAALRKGDQSLHQSEINAALMATKQQLSCTAADGKMWLNLSLILSQSEGFSGAALAAWKQAAYMTPKEAWLAQLRLLLMLRFMPHFDEEGLEIALRDSATLQASLKLRRREFLQQSGFENFSELDRFIQTALQNKQAGAQNAAP